MTRDEALTLAYSIGTPGEAWWQDDIDMMAFADKVARRALDADPGAQFAHRLAIMLECMMLNPVENWNDAGALLDEYHYAVMLWNEANGQPYVSGFGKN